METPIVSPPTAGAPGMSVRDATFDVWRRLEMQEAFANPGSTEIALLARLPDDLTLVLGLHEASVVGMATGYAIARERPSLVVLHTTAGLGNAVGALATARANRAPLVVVVGQQDRRHLAFEPFLAGQLDGLGGRYPVWAHHPARAQDVPGAIARAWFEARDGRGPAIVTVPMDDWLQPMDPGGELAAPLLLRRGSQVDPSALSGLVELLGAARRPTLVVGAGADSRPAWAALEQLADRLGCPVWQEPFGARAGFSQVHPRFAGHLPARRSALRAVLAEHDVLLVVGAPVFRQYAFDEGPLVPPGIRVAVITDDGEEARRSPADLMIQAEPAPALRQLLRLLGDGGRRRVAPSRTPADAGPPAPGALRAEDVFVALAERLAEDAVVLEETPSSRDALHRLLPARSPLGFVSAAAGGLGFALPAAVGVRMAAPGRPVVAVVGDGSALYSIQALWSAVHYRVGVLFVVLANGRYAIMDRLAAEAGDLQPPWPGFSELSVGDLARGMGCPSLTVKGTDDLSTVLDRVVPGLAERAEPLLLEIAVADRPRT